MPLIFLDCIFRRSSSKRLSGSTPDSTLELSVKVSSIYVTGESDQILP
jgi:hypothetical protein